MKKIIVVGTLDTKGIEVGYLAESIQKAGGCPFVIDVGLKSSSFLYKVDINRETVAVFGGSAIEDVEKLDQFEAIQVMIKGSIKIVTRLNDNDEVSGIICIGGSIGTTIGTSIMQCLPIGFPKLIVSTIAAGRISTFIARSDIIVVNSIVDMAGLNSISRSILTNAAYAIVGMSQNEMQITISDDIQRIGATMFGVTTPCVEKARAYLEKLKYEVTIFHAVGTGGRVMEDLTREGYFKGILDVTTTEMADELVGGIFNAGKDRMEAAINARIPYVVSCGAMDMVNFGPPETVPEQFRNRNLHRHCESITLMRTDINENIRMGEIIASKLNRALSPVALFFPKKGLSSLDKQGNKFYGPEEDSALYKSIKDNIKNNYVELVDLDLHINEEEFALSMTKRLQELLHGNI